MIRLSWALLALCAGVVVGLLLTATQAPPAPDPRHAYYLVTETP